MLISHTLHILLREIITQLKKLVKENRLLKDLLCYKLCWKILTKISQNPKKAKKDNKNFESNHKKAKKDGDNKKLIKSNKNQSSFDDFKRKKLK
jgi:hypothetical protein